jgi:predicted sulfurtransferase
MEKKTLKSIVPETSRGKGKEILPCEYPLTGESTIKEVTAWLKEMGFESSSHLIQSVTLNREVSRKELIGLVFVFESRINKEKDYTVERARSRVQSATGTGHRVIQKYRRDGVQVYKTE